MNAKVGFSKFKNSIKEKIVDPFAKFNEDNTQKFIQFHENNVNAMNLQQIVIANSIERSKHRIAFRKQAREARRIQAQQGAFQDILARLDNHEIEGQPVLQAEAVGIPEAVENIQEKPVLYHAIDRKACEVDNYICPITYGIMEDPVIATDGHSYERDAIQHMIKKGNCRSPVTNENISKDLVSNIALRNSIQGYLWTHFTLLTPQEILDLFPERFLQFLEEKYEQQLETIVNKEDELMHIKILQILVECDIKKVLLSLQAIHEQEN